MEVSDALVRLALDGRVILPDGAVVELMLDIERKTDPGDHNWNFLDPYSGAPWSGMDQGRVNVTPAIKITRP